MCDGCLPERIELRNRKRGGGGILNRTHRLGEDAGNRTGDDNRPDHSPLHVSAADAVPSWKWLKGVLDWLACNVRAIDWGGISLSRKNNWTFVLRCLWDVCDEIIGLSRGKFTDYLYVSLIYLHGVAFIIRCWGFYKWGVWPKKSKQRWQCWFRILIKFDFRNLLRTSETWRVCFTNKIRLIITYKRMWKKKKLFKNWDCRK